MGLGTDGDALPSAFSVEYRYGTRVLEPDDVRRVISVAGLVFFVSGLAEFQVLAVGDEAVKHDLSYAVHAGIACVVGLLALGIAYLAPREVSTSWYQRCSLGIHLTAPVFISSTLIAVGTDVAAVGTPTYLVPMIMGFYLLPQRWAYTVHALAIAGYGVLMASIEDALQPLANWGFFTAVASAIAVVVGSLVRRIDTLATSEHHARVELAAANAALATRVDEQGAELTAYQRLRRFLAPQVADAVLDSGADRLLEPHRREIAVLFSDLRGFTSFATRVEPEEVMHVLNAYYRAVGDVVHEFSATSGHFAGDGVMVYLNDPVLCDDPAGTACAMALRLRAELLALKAGWDRREYDIGFGIGLAFGHATLGVIGFDDRSDYTPIGPVVNLAARLCAAAEHGQVLVDHRLRVALGERVPMEAVDGLVLKGFGPNTHAYALATDGAGRGGALRVE